MSVPSTMVDTASHILVIIVRRKRTALLLQLLIILLVACLPGCVDGFSMSRLCICWTATTKDQEFQLRSSDHHNRWRRQTKSQENDENSSITNNKVLCDDVELLPDENRLESLEIYPSTAAILFGRRNLVINAVALGVLGASGLASYSLLKTSVYTPTGFRRVPRIQFIAALGDPQSSFGTEAKSWGLWMEDPGPRGVWLKDYNKEIVQNDNHAPAGWTYDPKSWWVEEHGLIMEAPKFPLKEGRYLVTGGRLVTTGLTIDSDGRWKLDEGTLFDVTHLPCRSARYQPLESADGSATSGSPLAANLGDFPVSPGAVMPEIMGCNKQDYAVLFVVGKAEQE